MIQSSLSYILLQITILRTLWIWVAGISSVTRCRMVVETAFNVSKGWAEIWGLVAVLKVTFWGKAFFLLKSRRAGDFREENDLLGPDTAFLSKLGLCELWIQRRVGGTNPFSPCFPREFDVFDPEKACAISRVCWAAYLRAVFPGSVSEENGGDAKDQDEKMYNPGRSCFSRRAKGVWRRSRGENIQQAAGRSRPERVQGLLRSTKWSGRPGSSPSGPGSRRGPEWLLERVGSTAFGVETAHRPMGSTWEPDGRAFAFWPAGILELPARDLRGHLPYQRSQCPAHKTGCCTPSRPRPPASLAHLAL